MIDRIGVIYRVELIVDHANSYIFGNGWLIWIMDGVSPIVVE